MTVGLRCSVSELQTFYSLDVYELPIGNILITMTVFLFILGAYTCVRGYRCGFMVFYVLHFSIQFEQRS